MPSWPHRSDLKKVFSPDIGVDTSVHVLAIREYACSVTLGLALISNENPNFEMASEKAGQGAWVHQQ